MARQSHASIRHVLHPSIQTPSHTQPQLTKYPNTRTTGYHPWFSHAVSLTPPKSKQDHYRSLFLTSSTVQPEHEEAFARLWPVLPEPHLLSDLLSELCSNLGAHPNAMLGEVGIDRAARVPFPVSPLSSSSSSSHSSCCTPEDSEDHPSSSSPAQGNENDNPEDVIASRRELSPFVTPLSHQFAILEAQIDLAVSLRRNISIHSVKAPQPTRDFLDRMAKKHGKDWLRISVDMHSCGLSPQVWKEIEVRTRTTDTDYH